MGSPRAGGPSLWPGCCTSLLGLLSRRPRIEGRTKSFRYRAEVASVTWTTNSGVCFFWEGHRGEGTRGQVPPPASDLPHVTGPGHPQHTLSPVTLGNGAQSLRTRNGYQKLARPPSLHPGGSCRPLWQQTETSVSPHLMQDSAAPVHSAQTPMSVG